MTTSANSLAFVLIDGTPLAQRSLATAAMQTCHPGDIVIGEAVDPRAISALDRINSNALTGETL